MNTPPQVCAKVGYHTQQQARKALKSCRRAARDGFRNRKEDREYLCPFCHKWHLTSKQLNG